MICCMDEKICCMDTQDMLYGYTRNAVLIHKILCVDIQDMLYGYTHVSFFLSISLVDVVHVIPTHHDNLIRTIQKVQCR